ncbi:uncharacterized protein LOC102378436 [Alligator sinensis]|uniref:Uncharacterized protein LOC102378436 n=1 Tax=Alligator sinensis TaxID=38654 RepID=A0A1U8DPG4_ALLSI|nr:uncharacterized protein LOC102378436 [Alligator sinensis]
MISGKKLRAASEITNYIYRSREKVASIQPEELFTAKKPNATRMLLVGNTAKIISRTCKRLQQKWASEENKVIYGCVIYIPCKELKSSESPMSVRQLLEQQCKELAPVLPDLLSTRTVLIILDGLEEFKDDLSDTQSSGSLDIDTPLVISALVWKVITKDLLPETDVLVTAQLTTVSEIGKHFEDIFVIFDFTSDQIKQYFDIGLQTKEIFHCNFGAVTKQELLPLVAVPLQIDLLCDALMTVSKNLDIRNEQLTPDERVSSSSQLSSRTLEADGTDTTPPVPALNADSKFLEDIKEITFRLAKMCYDCLVSDAQEIQREDLERYRVDPDILTKHFPHFFLSRKEGKFFVTQHPGVRSMFAALHCVRRIQDAEELKEFLDTWVSGHLPAQGKSKSLLKDVPFSCLAERQHFIRFFMALLPYKNTKDFLWGPRLLSDALRRPLQKWFEAWIAQRLDKMHLLNLLHCVFELHDTSLTQDVSRCFTHITLHHIPLSPADIGAMKYSLEKSKMQVLDLRLCDLQDENLEQLDSVMKSCTQVWISYNKLTEKSGRILQRVLEYPNCAMQYLSVLVNKLGSNGAKHLWTALETNRSLKILHLYDNSIKDEGVENLAQSLWKNCSLQLLNLCANKFGKAGIQNIEEVKRHRPDLQVVLKMTESEQLLDEVIEMVEEVFSEQHAFDKKWLLKTIQTAKKDLHDEGHLREPVRGKVIKLKKLLRKVEDQFQAQEPGKDCILKLS